MTGEEIMRQFLPSSPFPGHLGGTTVGLTVSGTAVAKGLVTYKLG